MNLGKANNAQKIGARIGFIAAFFVISIGIFIILTLLKRMPASWGFLHICAIVLAAVILGYIIGRLIR